MERAETLSDQEHCLSTRLPVLLQRSVELPLCIAERLLSLAVSERQADRVGFDCLAIQGGIRKRRVP